MQQIWDSCGKPAITFLAHDLLRPVGNRIKSLVASLQHKQLMVGVITPIPAGDLEIIRQFEGNSLSDTGLLRVWSGSAAVKFESDGRLHIYSSLPGVRKKAEYIPVDPDDVVLCDLALNRENFQAFKTTLELHTHSLLKQRR